MRQQYGYICLLLLFISGYQTQETTTTQEPTTTLPDWYGDPKICTTNTPTTISPIPAPPLPRFANQAEYTLERVTIAGTGDSTSPSHLTLSHYMYDYDANTLSLGEDRNGTIDVQFYDYSTLQRSTYYLGDTCNVDEISKDSDLDGRSAINSTDNTWHIRPLNEFLLFSLNRPDRQVTPLYIGQDTIRGIPVDTWQSCFVDRANYRTEKRLWSFAQRGISMPDGIVGDIGVPVYAIVNASVVSSDNTQISKSDYTLNILSYRPTLTGSNFPLTPPKGVFCDNVTDDQLISLKDVGIGWPDRFSVRVEASTSRNTDWQRFHLYYNQGGNGTSRRVRYDYMPPGAEDFQSVIHDYTENLTYVIDHRIGSCNINRGVEIRDVNPLVDPIRFFIKYEANVIFSPPEKAWENKGLQPCRTGSIKCTTLTTSVVGFPVMVESDTGAPTDESWEKTNVEYSWAMRGSGSSSNVSDQLDYPVSLYLKMYRNGGSNTDDVEYEFYEMSHDGDLSLFDTSICYRSLNYEYLHLVLVLKLNRGNIIDGTALNRRQLYRTVQLNLVNLMQIKYSRITGLEIDHEEVSNDVTVFFTVLGQTPNPGSDSGFIDDEPTAVQARDNVQQLIDDGQFEFDMYLRDGSEVQFRAQPGTLKSSKQYMSTHSNGKKLTNESYTSGSQALAIVVGSLGGLFVGVLLAAVIRIVRKEPMPALPEALSNPIPTISFHAKQSPNATSDA